MLIYVFAKIRHHNEGKELERFTEAGACTV